MSKKDKNKKLVKQNKRNRILNRRYSSTVKTLFKLFKNKIKDDLIVKEEKIFQISKLIKTLTSFLDKAVKKKVIHKNTAARKKSIISKLVKVVNIS